jgi:hypothetical protein
MKRLGFGQRTDGTRAVAQIDERVAGLHSGIMQYWRRTKRKTGNPRVRIAGENLTLPGTIRAGSSRLQKQGRTPRLRETGIDENPITGRLRTEGDQYKLNFMLKSLTPAMFRYGIN